MLAALDEFAIRFNDPHSLWVNCQLEVFGLNNIRGCFEVVDGLRLLEVDNAHHLSGYPVDSLILFCCSLNSLGHVVL